MPRVIHFEINADDPERAARFYREAFGWDVNKWEGPQEYWLAATGPDDQPGINGAIMPRMEKNTTVNTIDVPSLDEAIEKVKAAGGKVVTEKMEIPDIGTFAYAVDTEGNAFGILESLPGAASM